jgi:mono/diheme cytochrome c family protein
MNTSKQVNVMIGLLFLVAAFYAVNVFAEPNREEAAVEDETHTFSERGAELFVTNCRTCHGLDGLGPAEGGVAPALNNPAFLILGEENAFGVDATSAGVAEGIRTFLHNTIACGRVNTAMPTWSLTYGGPLSEQQIDYLVTMITEGRWDLVKEIGEEHDQAQNPPVTPEDILVSDPSSLAVTSANCGQYNSRTAAPFRERDPFASGGTPEPTATSEPGETATPNPAEDAVVQGQPVREFFAGLCANCHGADRGGGIGPSLAPDALTEPDAFYIDCITNGRPGTAMAPYGGGTELTADEVQSIVTWLKETNP